MSCINVCSAPIRQSRMPAENQGAMHAAFRTATWGVIPLAALVGGLAVTLLTGPLGILDATRVVMAGGTMLAALSFVPAIRVQPLLDAAERRREPERGLWFVKTVLITGTSSGIGRATAVAAARAGWTTVATMRDLDRRRPSRGEAGVSLTSAA